MTDDKQRAAEKIAWLIAAAIGKHPDATAVVSWSVTNRRISVEVAPFAQPDQRTWVTETWDE